MKELDELYDWLYDLKENRVSYGKTGMKHITQEDMNLGMELYLKLKKKIQGIENGMKLYRDTKKAVRKIKDASRKW